MYDLDVVDCTFERVIEIRLNCPVALLAKTAKQQKLMLRELTKYFELVSQKISVEMHKMLSLFIVPTDQAG